MADNDYSGNGWWVTDAKSGDLIETHPIDDAPTFANTVTSLLPNRWYGVVGWYDATLDEEA